MTIDWDEVFVVVCPCDPCNRRRQESPENYVHFRTCPFFVEGYEWIPVTPELPTQPPPDPPSKPYVRYLW